MPKIEKIVTPDIELSSIGESDPLLSIENEVNPEETNGLQSPGTEKLHSDLTPSIGHVAIDALESTSKKTLKKTRERKPHRPIDEANPELAEANYTLLVNLFANHPRIREAENVLREKVKNHYKRDDAQSDYMDNAGVYTLLTKENEVELFTSLEEGARTIHKYGRSTEFNPEDEEKLITAAIAHRTITLANLRLVMKIAREFKDHNLEMTDLLQEGNIGLGKAIAKFRFEKGYKFSTYATWWIRQSIRRGIVNTSRVIKIPINQQELAYTIRAKTSNLREDLGRDPTIARFQNTQMFQLTR